MELAYYASAEGTTYLKVMLTLNPLLPVVPKMPDDLSPSSVTRDDRAIAIYALKWLENIKELNEHTAQRPYKLFAVNSSGLQVFLSRYLTAQAPPDGYTSRRAVLHLVSMIPFVKDIQSFIGEMDLWCTNNQFWEIGAGDEEEHSVMLYCYLRHLKNSESRADGAGRGRAISADLTGDNAAAGTLVQRSQSSRFGSQGQGNTYPTEDFIRRESTFLAVGKAFPEGESVYLIVRDWNRVGQDPATGLGKGILNDPSKSPFYSAESFLVINAWTGHVYSALDPFCPLKSIHTLVTPYNLWVNIQPEESPATISFNVLDIRRWRPFFSGQFPPLEGGLHTIQQEIEYIPTAESYCSTVEQAVFQAIRNGIRRWRSKRQR
jgi:coiled-coil and C2 domain-containing protein 2A